MTSKEPNKLTALVNTRTTPDEAKLLATLAAEQGLNLSQYVRKVLLANAEVSRDTRLLIGESAVFLDAVLSIVATGLRVDRATLDTIVSVSQRKRDALINNRLRFR